MTAPSNYHFTGTDKFPRLVKMLLKIRRKTHNDFIFEVSKLKKVDVSGVSSSYYKYMNGGRPPTLQTFMHYLEVFEYDMILVPRENRKRDI